MSGEGDLKLAEKFEKATVVLIDIAGTTSSICFVKDTLFPYVLNKSESYLTDKWENTEVQDIIKALRENDSEILKEGEKDAIIKSVASSIKSLTEKNSDLKGFKTLQGLIYKEGYAAGDLKGHVFPDVAVQLPIWANGKKVCVYSTGSVESQKLMFTHSSEGNLTEHISEYFDMSVGSKTEADSYKKIAEKIQCKPEDIIYLTDSVAEAKVAVEAGVSSVLVLREGNDEISEDDKKKYSVITSFSELSVETSGKRKINEDGEQEAPPAKVAKTDPEKETEKVEDTPSTEAEEKMEVDTPEVPVESKVDEPMEKCNDSETVTSTSEVNDIPDEKVETDAAESAGEKEKPAAIEEKPTEEKKEKDVPSTEKVQEESKTEQKPDNKTEEDKKVVSETKTEENKKPTESTETKESENKETEKETISEKGKETLDSSDKKEKEETKDTVDSSNESKEEPKVKTEETTEKTDKDCKDKHETEESENVKTESEVTNVEEKTEDTKPTEENKEPAPKTDEKTAEKNENVSETNQATNETNDVPETKENSESTVDGKTEEVKSEPEKEKEISGKENDEQKSKNGDTKENGNTEDKKDKSEEKENKSELANGAHIENGDEKKLPEEESEIKVKKIESENTETEAAVSVEVTA